MFFFSNCVINWKNAGIEMRFVARCGSTWALRVYQGTRERACLCAASVEPSLVVANRLCCWFRMLKVGPEGRSVQKQKSCC